MSATLLLSPVRVGALELPTRVVMAPMTRARSGPHGVPTPMNAAYYAQRASAGLIIAEATQISAEGQGYMRTPGIYTPEQVSAWRQVTQAVHARGGRIVLQLWHVGRVARGKPRAAHAQRRAVSDRRRRQHLHCERHASRAGSA